jgi:hypothetical protein
MGVYPLTAWFRQEASACAHLSGQYQFIGSICRRRSCSRNGTGPPNVYVEYQETVLDEDKLDMYKLMCLRVVVQG